MEWVWRRVAAMGLFERVVVATESERVAAVCRDFGADVVLTDPEHPSGTDRVAEVADRAGFREFDVLANVQGDEPLVEEAHLGAAVALVREGPWDVGTCATPLCRAEDLGAPSVVKAVRAADGRALYFSRAPVPWNREGTPSAEALAGPPFLRHVGIYVYRREALMRWVALPPSPLERIEHLEQLRALEAGIGVGVAVVPDAPPGVDTAEDVIRMEGILKLAGEAREGAAHPASPPRERGESGPSTGNP